VSKPLYPEYNGFVITLSQLEGWETPHFGYQIRSATHQEAGGAYPSKHEATCRALTRIETLTHDSRLIRAERSLEPNWYLETDKWTKGSL